MHLDLLDHKRDEENRKPRLSRRWNSTAALNPLALREVILAGELCFCPLTTTVASNQLHDFFGMPLPVSGPHTALSHPFLKV